MSLTAPSEIPNIEIPNIIILGSIHMDILVRAPHIPLQGETLAGHSFALRAGGKGCNQAIHASMHGGNVFMIGRVGADSFGQKLVETLQFFRVNTQFIEIDTVNGSGMSVALIDDEGDYGAVIVSGANLDISEAEVVKMVSLIDTCGATCIVLQSEIPLPIVERAARAAQERKVLVIFNAAPASKSQLKFLDLVDILVVNEFEAETLTGHTVSSIEQARAAIQQLTKSVPSVLLTLGHNGVLIADEEDGLRHLPGHTVSVIDTHGAGDSFIGSLAARLVVGDNLVEASRYANATAALTVTHAGPHSPEVTPERVRRLLEY